MPEGDTIFRMARMLQQGLAGRTVTHFDSVFSELTRTAAADSLCSRVITQVTARGKHLLIWFSGNLVLRTHMRMHGAWHLYVAGDRWRRPRAEMRIVIGTAGCEAVAFNVPVAELTTVRDLERSEPVRDLGPDILAADFDAEEAARRVEAMPQTDIADALLDQTAVAGIGNIFKSESLYAARVHPFAPVSRLTHDQILRVIERARRLMQAAATERRARFSVYGRAGQPCRRCGTSISRRAQGLHRRLTYWCARCQQAPAPAA
jgi:endonuclease-8